MELQRGKDGGGWGEVRRFCLSECPVQSCLLLSLLLSSVTEDEMAGWRHRLSGREFEQTVMVRDREAGVLRSMGSQRIGHDSVAEPHDHKERAPCSSLLYPQLLLWQDMLGVAQPTLSRR